jgi:glucose/mannose-6-phosphate isomerase
MRDAILSFVNQLKKGIELGSTQRIARPYRQIISCGMGGSAIAGEMLAMVADNVIVHWDYDLPASVASQDLVICTSWSGQTEETISSYQSALKHGCETLVITTGGRLAELAKENKSPVIILPTESIYPRLQVGLMAGALFSALGLEDKLPTVLKPETLELLGQKLAQNIGPRLPVIYSAYPWRRLTGFWKMAYSETAKRQVMANWFPSGAHSEIVGWEGPYQKEVAFVLLRDKDESERYAKNFQALLALLPQKEYTVLTVELSGSTTLEKAFNNYILALWTSYYVAQSLGVDPLATTFLDEFKKLKK